MRYLVILATFLLFGCSMQPPPEVFPEATDVRLYILYQDKDKDAEWRTAHPQGRRLSPSQTRDLRSAFYIETNKEKEFAACFIPHHAFRFFDAKGVQVGEVEVCFCCSGVQISPYKQLQLGQDQYFEARLGRIEGLIEELGERTDINCDE